MPDADAAPAPVRLFHEHWPNGREFDPVVAETMRLQGWTDQTGDPVPEGETDGADDADDNTPPITGFGHFTTNPGA